MSFEIVCTWLLKTHYFHSIQFHRPFLPLVRRPCILRCSSISRRRDRVYKPFMANDLDFCTNFGILRAEKRDLLLIISK